MSTQTHPLSPPYIIPGHYPGATEQDKVTALALVKQEIANTTVLESCVVKGTLSGVMGPFLLSLITY